MRTHLRFRMWSILVLAIVGSVIIFMPTIAHAQNEPWYRMSFSQAISQALAGGFKTLLVAVFGFYMQIAGIVLVFLGRMLDYVLEISKFAENDWVRAGWQTVRDTLNVFFILALLAMAFATIAGIDAYDFRKLLPRLIVAALLVNFSLAIGGAIVNASNIMMIALASGDAGAQAPVNPGDPLRGPGTSLSVRLARVTVINHFFAYKPDIEFDNLLPKQPPFAAQPDALLKDDVLKYAIGMMLASVMITIVTIAIGAVALMLLVRVVALYIILILSPVGFVFNILPLTANYAKEWWGTLVKYVLYGPVIMFFLALATRIGTTQSSNNPKFTTLSEQLGITSKGAFTSFFFDNPLFGSVFEAVFVVLFIIAGLLVAQRLGVAGASIGTWAAGSIRSIGLSPVTASAGAVWSRTGAPAVAGYKRAREEVAKDRVRTGLFGQAGARAGTLFDPKQREAVQRRLEDEQVKDLGTRSATLKELTLSTPAHARYALDKELVRDATDFETALGAVKMNSPEFNKGAKNYQKRFVVAGTNFVTQARKDRPATDADYNEALRGLSADEAYEAIEREIPLRAKIVAGEVTATRNLATGIANAGDKVMAEAIAYGLVGRNIEANPAFIEELERRKMV